MYTKDVSAGSYTEDELFKRYGKRPWFLYGDPRAAPPFVAFKVASKDTRGRGYNFPNTSPTEVHVRLPKGKPGRTEDRPAELPEVGERVTLLKDAGEFLVEAVDLGGRRQPNTAILTVKWFN
jgi:hypothetical protein